MTKIFFFLDCFMISVSWTNIRSSVPQKNRCITFWGGWKYSQKSLNYCTPRLRKMRRHLSVSSFTLLVWCKPSSSTRLIASFTFDQWCQPTAHIMCYTHNNCSIWMFCHQQDLPLHHHLSLHTRTQQGREVCKLSEPENLRRIFLARHLTWNTVHSETRAKKH